MDQPSFIQAVLEAPLRPLEDLTHLLLGTRLPLDYVATLTKHEKTDALQACLMVALIIHFTIIPRPFQLQASLSILNRQDSIITAGTGSGKTLCLLIPISLRPNSISITISPLKQLQVTQVRVEHVYHYYNT